MRRPSTAIATTNTVPTASIDSWEVRDESAFQYAHRAWYFSTPLAVCGLRSTFDDARRTGAFVVCKTAEARATATFSDPADRRHAPLPLIL